MKHVMITGAGSGLGLGMATRYLNRGYAGSVLDLAVSQSGQQKGADTGGRKRRFPLVLFQDGYHQ